MDRSRSVTTNTCCHKLARWRAQAEGIERFGSLSLQHISETRDYATSSIKHTWRQHKWCHLLSLLPFAPAKMHVTTKDTAPLWRPLSVVRRVIGDVCLQAAVCNSTIWPCAAAVFTYCLCILSRWQRNFVILKSCINTCRYIKVQNTWCSMVKKL